MIIADEIKTTCLTDQDGLVNTLQIVMLVVWFYHQGRIQTLMWKIK